MGSFQGMFPSTHKHSVSLSHTLLAWGGLFIVTGTSTNIDDLVPQIFVSHESREPLNFTRVVTSQTKAINKVWNPQYPPRGMEKEISAGKKDQVLLQWQMVLHKRSTLGSFCCSLFINNLSDIGITARVQRYADNKTLFYSPRSPAGTAKSLQSDFSVAGHFWGCLCQESTASLQREDEMEKFHGSPAWPVSYPDFSARLTQNKTAKVTDVTAQGLHLPGWQETFPIQLLRTLPGTALLLPQQGKGVTTSSHSVPGTILVAWWTHQENSVLPLYWSKEHGIVFIPASGVNTEENELKQQPGHCYKLPSPREPRKIPLAK